jgi:hypothetical protein
MVKLFAWEDKVKSQITEKREGGFIFVYPSTLSSVFTLV